MSINLHPCPACGSDTDNDGCYVYCKSDDCHMIGPSEDHNGDKWNALCAKLDAGKPDLSTKYHEHRMRIAESFMLVLLANERMLTDLAMKGIKLVPQAVSEADALLAALGWEKP